jgi:hypothetical protein
MESKEHLLGALRAEFGRWEELLAPLSEEKAAAPLLPSHWSTRDAVAHLWAWQQRTIARLEAALEDRELRFPPWPAQWDPEEEGEPDELNAWLYESHVGRDWDSVYRDWREGFRRTLELGAEIPEANLRELGRYPWLGPCLLSAVLIGTLEHHQEHREWLEPRLGARGRQ